MEDGAWIAVAAAAPVESYGAWWLLGPFSLPTTTAGSMAVESSNVTSGICQPKVSARCFLLPAAVDAAMCARQIWQTWLAGKVHSGFSFFPIPSKKDSQATLNSC